MKKKILLSIIAGIVVIGGIAAFSAYEAHVINVTAHIENALSVDTYDIDFGTVFPQEKLNENLIVSLSDSFYDQDRVNLVNYKIVQKPKPIKPEDAKWCQDRAKQYWAESFFDIFFDITFLSKCYPPLCFYLSKEPDNSPPNDIGLSAYHKLTDIAYGSLTKISDPSDEWTIDLDVPCFEGQCAQEWQHPGWEPPIELESQTFGCDLWVEVTGISETLQLANYVVINEVFYDPPGIEPDEEFIEIYNPTGSLIDLSDYKLGDEETQGGGEGMYEFPEGSSIGPGEFIVVANKAVAFFARYGFNPDFELIESDGTVPNMEKYTAWASGSVALANTGDEVLLLDENDNVVDVVVWEGGGYFGVVPHPGVVAGHSISRIPAGIDTDNCANDFGDDGTTTPKQ